MEGLALLTDGFISTFGVQGTSSSSGSSQTITGKVISASSASGKISTSEIITATVDNSDDVGGIKKSESSVQGNITEEIIQGKVDE